MKTVRSIKYFNKPGAIYVPKDKLAGQENAEIEAYESDEDAEADFKLYARANLRFIPDDLVRRIDYHLLNPYISRISDQYPVDEQYELDRKTRNREQVFDVEGFEKARAS